MTTTQDRRCTIDADHDEMTLTTKGKPVRATCRGETEQPDLSKRRWHAREFDQVRPA